MLLSYNHFRYTNVCVNKQMKINEKLIISKINIFMDELFLLRLTFADHKL